MRERGTIQRASDSQNGVVAYGMSFSLWNEGEKADTDSERNRKILLGRSRSWEEREEEEEGGENIGCSSWVLILF